MKRFILLLQFITSFFCYSIAQPLCEINHFSINEGLAQSIVTAILQDQKGFIWLSTWDGLNKYDGYTFKKYKSLQEEGSTLTGNRFNHIYVSRYGDIWCHTNQNRAYLFNNQTEKYMDVLQSVEMEMHQTNLVKRIFPLPKGIAWIICERGNCFRIDELAIREKKGITLYNTFGNTLKGEYIYTVFQDSEEDEWILTNKGISIVGRKEIKSDFPFKYIQEHHNNIWLASSNGKLARYDQTTQTPQFVELPHDKCRILTMHSLDNNILALGTNVGLVLFNTENLTFQQISIQTPTHPDNNVAQIFQDSKGELWLFSHDKGVIRVNVKNQEIQHLFTPPSDVIHFERANLPFVYEDPIGCVWVLPREGNLSYYDRKEKKLTGYLVNPDDPKSGFYPFVRNYCADNQGNLWLTSNRGAKKVSFLRKHYEEIHLDYGMEVRAFLCDSRNNFWVATKSGKIRIFDANMKLKGYLSNSGKITQAKECFQHSAYCLTEDQDGNIWIGTRHDGLFLLKRKENTSHSFQLEQYKNDPDNNFSLSSNNVYSILHDDKKRIWIGCYGSGINLVQKDQEGKIRFIHSGNLLSNYPSSHSSKVRYITQVPGNVIMVGTTEGLLTFSSEFTQPEEIKFYRNVCQPGVPSSLSNSDVMQIFTDSRNDIYLVTFTGGINKVVSGDLLSESIAFKSYTERNGLLSDLTLSMIEDKKGFLWIVSENALCKYDPYNETFENFDHQFLKKSSEFSEAIPTLTPNHQIAFGTDRGVMEIDPDQIQKSNYTPYIAFTDIKIQGSPLYTDIDNQEKLTLEPSERNITLQFAALDFINPDGIQYAYRLKGLEEKWNYADKNRTASYLNIPKGKYSFEVKSTNGDGLWVDNIRSLSIEVLPTFGETIWALILYFLLFILLTGSIVYVLFYIYRLRHRVSMEQQLANIKLRFFTDISHELRTPLTLISSPVNEVLVHEPLTPTAKEHLALVQKNTNRMLQLVNQILDFRKIQNHKMKVLVEEVNIISLLHKIASSFNQIAEEQQINFSMEYLRPDIRVWIDKDKFEKIFYNLISNAFKYTSPGKKITLRIVEETSHLSISVMDEGIGIQPQKLSTLFQRFETLVSNNILQPSSGIGLSLVKELVELHHGMIEVFSEPGKGSEFKVSFRTGNEHFQKDDQAEFILSDTETSPQTVFNSSDSPDISYSPTEIPDKGGVDEKDSILIVEDNDELRHFLSRTLTKHYQVLMAKKRKRRSAKSTGIHSGCNYQRCDDA